MTNTERVRTFHLKMYTLIAFITLFLTSSLAGDPCPSKTELRSCNCKQIFISDSSIQWPPKWRSTTPASEFRTSTLGQTTTLSPFSTPQPKNGSMYTVVDCMVPKTITALEEAIVFALHRKAVDKLTVSNVPPKREHTLARLPSGWLKNTRVKQFEVRDTILSGDFIWFTEPFEGQEQSLLWLTATRCYLYGALTHDTVGTVNTKGLGSLPLVEGVDFSYNQLTILTQTAFRHPPANLSSLILSHNSIQKIEQGAFQHIPLLKILNLSHNLLENVTRNMLASPARQLETIDLSWNSLLSLPNDFFHNMPALKIINLSKNFLFTLPEKPWASIWDKLSEIDLSNNFIACDCNLLWLIKIMNPSTGTTPPEPTQSIQGKCTHNQVPTIYSRQYDLSELTRDKLVC